MAEVEELCGCAISRYALAAAEVSASIVLEATPVVPVDAVLEATRAANQNSNANLCSSLTVGAYKLEVA